MDWVVSMAIVIGLFAQPLSLTVGRPWVAAAGLAVGLAGVVGLYVVLST